MSRTKRPPSSAEIEDEIRRLTDARARALAAEDQRRGELLRQYLGGAHGDALRVALAPLVGHRDAALFGIDDGADTPSPAAR
jgi:hypothetical protein